MTIGTKTCYWRCGATTINATIHGRDEAAFASCAGHLREWSLARNEGSWLYVEGLCQTFQNINRWRVLLALDHADIVAIETRQVGKLLLREPPCKP